jgi:hypothetical protein
MPTAKKASKAKNKTKPKAKAVRAALKTQPRAAKKRRSTAKPRVAAAKSKATATSKRKPAVKRKPKNAPKATPKKAVSPAKTKGRAAPTKVRNTPRRDGGGRLDPKYARDLLALSRENRDKSDDRAFFETPRSADDLAEELGKEAVATMTSGEDQSDHLISEEVEEERGGPFIKTRSSEEFAEGTDRSNPRDATREPFPRT